MLAPASRLPVGSSVAGGRSYTHQVGRGPVIVYRLPEGHVWDVRGAILDCGDPDCPDGIVSFGLVDDDDYRSDISMDFHTGREWDRFVWPGHKKCEAVFDELARSVLVQ